MREWNMRRKLYRYPSLVVGVDDLDERIKSQAMRLLSAYDRTPGIAGSGGGSGTGPGDPCGNAVANVIDPIRLRLDGMNEKRGEYAAVIIEVEEYLDTLDALERQVIELRYFKCLCWDAICDIEGYSRTTAYRIHTSAAAKCKGEF